MPMYIYRLISRKGQNGMPIKYCNSFSHKLIFESKFVYDWYMKYPQTHIKWNHYLHPMEMSNFWLPNYKL